MLARRLLIGLVVLFHCQLMAQSINKITGPLGVYHLDTGYTYSDTLGIDSIQTEDEFRLGELCMPNQGADNGAGFLSQVQFCLQWNANRVFAIIQPPSEKGVNNQPGDTSLYFPYPLNKGPGLIQGGERFSRLSQLYGPFCGAILDDFDGDTVTTRQVRDALQGKTLNTDGTVDENSEAITPDNKLYATIYSTAPNPTALSLLDGVAYWYYSGQDCCYMNLDSDISQLRISYPHKEIMSGIYLKNSALGWTDPVSVHYLLQHALDRYDDGDINGVLIFAGVYLPKDYMPLDEWNAFALPFWLDSLYYPFLGEAQGRVSTCYAADTIPLTGAIVRAFCEGRISGDTLMRSRQQTDANGGYAFGLWAGNRNTDSTFYWAVAQKAGYLSDTVGFWLKRGDTTNVPNIYLCPDVYANRSENNMLLFPNPNNGQFTVEANLIGEPNTAIRIYNMQGQIVFAFNGPEPFLTVNVPWLADGTYLVEILTPDKKEHLQQLMAIVH